MLGCLVAWLLGLLDCLLGSWEADYFPLCSGPPHSPRARSLSLSRQKYKAFLPSLRVLSGGGRVVNVLPALPAAAGPFTALGSASKDALASFTAALRLELAGARPGPVDVSLVEPVPATFGVKLANAREADRAHRMFKLLGRVPRYKHVFKGWLRHVAAPGVKTTGRSGRAAKQRAAAAAAAAAGGNGSFETPPRKGPRGSAFGTPAGGGTPPGIAGMPPSPATGAVNDAASAAAEAPPPTALAPLDWPVVKAVNHALTAR